MVENGDSAVEFKNGLEYVCVYIYICICCQVGKKKVGGISFSYLDLAGKGEKKKQRKKFRKSGRENLMKMKRI